MAVAAAVTVLAVVQQLVDYGLFSRRGTAATGAVAVLMVEMLVVAALEVMVAVAAARSKRAFGKRGRRRPVWVAAGAYTRPLLSST